MAPRPKANAKAAAALVRRREFLEELSHGVMPTMNIGITGDTAFARNLHEAGLIHMGQDTTTILPAGREWLKNYG